jgi:nitroreductase/FMN reductase [NAD(P)H]
MPGQPQVPDPRSTNTIRAALHARFGEELAVDENLAGLDELARIASRKVHRRYLDREIDPALLRLLCACALSAPSKSDLQQADILIVQDAEQRGLIAALLPDQTWVRAAPAFLVFLANGRRLVEISRLRDKPFPNDHLDQFFNAAIDTGIVLATFLRAADAVGLGCCPISVIRDHAARVSELLELPPRVIPVAGLCVGWPAEAGNISPRLSLASTLHQDRYDEGNLAERIDAFDRRRASTHPLAPRDPVRWGTAAFYGWSEDKARQFGVPQCADFGAFVRRQGFRLD